MACELICFYGTLMSDQKSLVDDQIQDKLEYINDCIIPGKLYKCEWYPALLPGNRPIQGELYKIIDSRVLSVLDEYEAVDNINPELPGFSRKQIMLVEPEQQAWVYYYDGHLSEDSLITANRWSG